MWWNCYTCSVVECAERRTSVGSVCDLRREADAAVGTTPLWPLSDVLKHIQCTNQFLSPVNSHDVGDIRCKR